MLAEDLIREVLVLFSLTVWVALRVVSGKPRAVEAF